MTQEVGMRAKSLEGYRCLPRGHADWKAIDNAMIQAATIARMWRATVMCTGRRTARRSKSY